MRGLLVHFVAVWLMVVAPAYAAAAEAIIAVATNFSEVAERLRSTFEASSGHRLTLTSGSTGKLYAQITQGAPFDVLLAADQERPRRLESSVHGIAQSRFTYATGQLVLWSPDARRIAGDGRRTLQSDRFSAIAIANPKLAPYGAAARQALQALGVWELLSDRIVQGENIGQAFTYVATRNAELGLVAMSQVISPRNIEAGSHWIVPGELYDPIYQDAVLLSHGSNNAAAMDFLAWLRSDVARSVIVSAGYGVD